MPHPYYRGSKFLLLNVALGLGTFIQILDTSIANVAVPYIAGNLAVSPDEGTWVITSFAASNAVVLPLTGWLSDYFGRVRLFVYSILLFSFVSFLCGFSTSLTMLVVFRVLQGAVAGSLIPLSQSLLITNSPPEKQGAVLGFWAMIVVVAPILGPIMGGYLTEEYSWPWIFYINVPIGCISALITWILLRDRESKIIRNPIDWGSLFFLVVGIACLQIMLDKGKDLDWFNSNTIISLFTISIISLAYFGVWNFYAKYPLVDFSFFSDRNFLIGTLVITIGYLLFFGSTVVIPLWLQTEQNYTAYWAGIAVAPIGIFPILFSVIVGRNLYRFDLRAITALSFFIFSMTYFYQANFTTQVDLSTVMFTRLMQGFGVTIFFVPLVQISLGNIPHTKYASASGVFTFIRILIGSGFGTSLSIELWSRREIFHHSRLSEAITSYNPTTTEFYNLLNQQDPSLSRNVLNQLTDKWVEQQAFTLATDDISWLAALIFLAMVPLPFLCKRIPKANQNVQIAH